MNCNPDDIESLHSRIFSAGITDGFYSGGWDQYPMMAEGLHEIGASKSAAAIDDLLHWLKPHYESGGIEAVLKEVESHDEKGEELTERYCCTDEDVRKLLMDLVERKSGD